MQAVGERAHLPGRGVLIADHPGAPQPLDDLPAGGGVGGSGGHSCLGVGGMNVRLGAEAQEHVVEDRRAE
jgi:hypothetical protein